MTEQAEQAEESAAPLHYHLHAATAVEAPGIDTPPAWVAEGAASHVTWWLAERATHLLDKAQWLDLMRTDMILWRDAVDAREPIAVGPFAGVVLHAVPHGECDCAAGA